jgi:hypothetical protein
LSATGLGLRRYGGVVVSGASAKRRKKVFPFDFGPRETRIEAAVTWGSVKQWAWWSVCGGRTRGTGQNQLLSKIVAVAV